MLSRANKRTFIAYPKWTLAIAALVFLVGQTVQPVSAQVKYDPDHPEVQQLINEGMAYLMGSGSTTRVGPRVMLGMAAYKAQVVTSPNPKEHPFIDAAIASIKEKCNETNLAGAVEFDKMYSSALACVFLLELDSVQYEPEILILLDHIQKRQQDSGAWGYRNQRTIGDTSQMQYIALALWLASERGFDVSYSAAKDALDWMVDTQQTDGGWWYKSPPDPVATNRDLSQTSRPPLVAAGLGTVYLYADLLRLMSRNGKLGPDNSEDGDLPPDVVDVTDEDSPETDVGGDGPRVTYDRGKMIRSMNAGNRWFENNFDPECEHYNMYFLYGYERYAALREYVEGDNKGVTDWYDQGVEFLKDIQGSDGSMVKGNGGEISANVQTAFAILFLTRSMSITIGGKASSVLHGGDGFKNDVILKERGTQVVSGSVERSVTDMLELIDNPDQDQWELYRNSLNDLKMDGDDVSRNQQMQLLRSLITHENHNARLIAVKFLSRQRSLDNAPAFIFALTDPEPEVVVAAHEALRFLSRNTERRSISVENNEIASSALNQHRRKWKEWYKKVMPDGILLQEPEER